MAQMTFSLLLAICQCAERYNRAVKQGCWQLEDVYKRQPIAACSPIWCWACRWSLLR